MTVHIDDLAAFASLAGKAAKGPLQPGDRAQLELWLAQHGANLIQTMGSIGATLDAMKESMELMGAQLRVLNQRVSRTEVAFFGHPNQAPEVGPQE